MKKITQEKREKGITLIALVITIVILLILAGVSINLVLGENGLINKAKEAKEKAEQDAVNTQVAFNNLYDEMTAVLEGMGDNEGSGGEKPITPSELPDIEATTPAGTVVKMPTTWTTLVGTAISDGNGTAIPLPKNFYYVGGDYDSGLVISDKPQDTLDASGTSMGNQFVWIPVEESDETFVRESFKSTELDTTRYEEPYASGYSDGSGTQEIVEYNTMRAQVLKYGGFYIGRFEAGINSTELRTRATEAQIVVSKKQVAPYNYAPWGASMSDIDSDVPIKDDSDNTIQSKGAVYLANSMYANSESVTSTLCYGIQWDAMYRYIGDYTRVTPAGTIQLTGSVSTDVLKEIYDLGGNCAEWTMEADTSYGNRNCRGGYNFGVPDCVRNLSSKPYSAYAKNGFRCTLYIK